MRASISVLFSQTKVNNVHQVALFAESHQEVIRLHVSVNEVLGVNVLDATDLQWTTNKDRQIRSSAARICARLHSCIHVCARSCVRV